MATTDNKRLIDLASDGKKHVPPPRNKLSRRLLPILLVVALLALIGYVSRERFEKKIAVSTAAVVAKTVSDGALVSAPQVSVQAPGWVEPSPYPIHASALTSGIVEEVLVLEGDTLEKGQAVAKLVAADAELALARAQAQLAKLDIDVARAQDDLKHPTELNRQLAVRQAQLGELKAKIEESKAVIGQKLALQSEAQKVFDRFSGLEPGIFPALEVEKAEFQLAARKAELEVARKEINVLEAGRPEIEAQIAAAEESLRLRIADNSALAAAKAAVALGRIAISEAQLRLDRMVVRSPAAGVVMDLIKAPGSKLMLDMDSPHSAHVVHLYQPDSLQIRCDVPLADAANVVIGQDAIIVVDILPDIEFRGRVSRFVHEANLSKNTVQAKVEIIEPSPLLKPEMLARVKFLAVKVASRSDESSSQATVLVPTEALVGVQKGTANIWLLTATGDRVEKREVKVGANYREQWRVVQAGLNPGDVVIVRPPQDLKENQRVAPTPAGGF